MKPIIHAYEGSDIRRPGKLGLTWRKGYHALNVRCSGTRQELLAFARGQNAKVVFHETRIDAEQAEKS